MLMSPCFANMGDNASVHPCSVTITGSIATMLPSLLLTTYYFLTNIDFPAHLLKLLAHLIHPLLDLLF